MIILSLSIIVVMLLFAGKSPISFAGYKAISMELMLIQPEVRKFTWLEGVFGWPFMVQNELAKGFLVLIYIG